MNTPPAPAAPRAPRLVFFGYERTDARSIKRIRSLQARGWEVLGFTFHRAHVTQPFEPTWENIHLGTTHSGRYLQRAWAIVRAVGIIVRHRHRLAEATALYAINPDNALLALLGRLAAGRRVPLTVEIADIQPIMTRQGAIPAILRAVERFVLRRSARLVTTSPGFVRHYFTPVQQVSASVFLLENKVWPADAFSSPGPDTRPAPLHDGRPWVVGCFGALRCRRSILLMKEIAAALPGRVRFVLRGHPAAGVDPAWLREQLAECPALSWDGGYRYPDDLPVLYTGIDLNWCFDFSASGTNSAWLLPNRLYEGGLAGCPALAESGTETAAWVAERGVGWSFKANDAANLVAFLDTLTPSAWAETRARCLTAPRDWFDGAADVAALDAALRSDAS